MADTLYARFKTSEGDFTVELFADKSPITVDNFKKLADNKFYDGTIFHRVIKDFMIQGGDPEGTGFGGSNNMIPDEFAPGLTFAEPGILAMANAGPNTGRSQFFITVIPTPWLQNHHSIFGKVIENYDVVERISKVKTNSADRPLKMLFWNLSPLRTVSKRRCIITHICFVAWIIHSIRDIRQTWRNVWLCITTAEEPSIQDHVCPLSLCGAKLFRVSMRPCIGSGK